MEGAELNWGRKPALYQLSIWSWEVFRSFHSCFSRSQIIHDSTGLIRRSTEGPRESLDDPPLPWVPRSSDSAGWTLHLQLFGELINDDLEEKWFNITKLFQDQVKVPPYPETVRYVRAGALWGMRFVSLMWQTYCSKFSNMHLLLPFPKPCHQAITFRSVRLSEEMQKDLLLEMLFLFHWTVCNDSDVQHAPRFGEMVVSVFHGTAGFKTFMLVCSSFGNIYEASLLLWTIFCCRLNTYSSKNPTDEKLRQRENKWILCRYVWSQQEGKQMNSARSVLTTELSLSPMCSAEYAEYLSFNG